MRIGFSLIKKGAIIRFSILNYLYTHRQVRAIHLKWLSSDAQQSMFEKWFFHRQLNLNLLMKISKINQES